MASPSRRPSKRSPTRRSSAQEGREARTTISDLALSPESIQLDCGMAACNLLPTAVALICNEDEKQNLRVVVADALIHLEHALPELKEDPIKRQIPNILAVTKSVLLRGDDEIPDEFRGAKTYEFGMQRIPEYLARFLCKESNADEALARFLLPHLLELLRSLDPAEIAGDRDGSSVKGGPGSSREAAVASLIRALPQTVPLAQCSQVVPVMFKFVCRDLPIVRSTAVSVLLNVRQINSSVLNNFPQQLLACIAEGCPDLFLSCAEDLYQAHPATIQANIGPIFTLGLRQAAPLLTQIAKRSPDSLLPHVAELVQGIDNTSTGQISLTLLQYVGNTPRGADALGSYCTVIMENGLKTDALVGATIGIAKKIAGVSSDKMICVVRALCSILAQNLTSRTKQEVLQTLVDFALSDDSTTVACALKENAALILGCREVNESLFSKLQDAMGDIPAVVEQPPVSTPVSTVSNNAATVTVGESAFSPRSALSTLFQPSPNPPLSSQAVPLTPVTPVSPITPASTTATLSPMDPTRKLSKDVWVNCKTFEEAVEYLKENIDLLEDVIGMLQLKMPLPSRVIVTSEAYRTLRMVFTCPLTSSEFVVESKQWQHWLRLTASLLILGQCELDPGQGDALNLAALDPLIAVRAIYNSYKTKSDEDVHQFIRQPFPSNKELDGLIVSLEQVSFFDRFTLHDGRWCAIVGIHEKEQNSRRGSGVELTPLLQNTPGQSSEASPIERSLLKGMLNLTEITYRASDAGYTLFDLKFEFDSTARTCSRRYKEFEQLDKELKAFGCTIVVPLPSKKWFGRFDESFLELRRAGLLAYMNALLEDDKALSSPMLQSFLRISDDVEEMESSSKRTVGVAEIFTLSVFAGAVVLATVYVCCVHVGGFCVAAVRFGW